MAIIGFIGLGNMGGPMAANLVKAGHTVHGFDLVAANNAAAQAEGVTIATSGSAAVADADIVVTMLPAGRHVLAVWAEVLAAARPGTLVIDSSTIDVDSARQAHAAAAKAGMASLDAPVSGGVGGARGATLTFMCGGSDAALARAQALLGRMGKKIVHCGPAGSGGITKLCNNLALAISMAGTAEAMNLGIKMGMDGARLAEVMNSSTARCWSSDTYNPVPG